MTEDYTPPLRADALDEEETYPQQDEPETFHVEFAKGGWIDRNGHSDAIPYVSENGGCLYGHMIRVVSGCDYPVPDPTPVAQEPYENGEGGWSYRPIFRNGEE